MGVFIMVLFLPHSELKLQDAKRSIICFDLSTWVSLSKLNRPESGIFKLIDSDQNISYLSFLHSVDDCGKDV